jgi:hypothetical protein
LKVVRFSGYQVFVFSIIRNFFERRKLEKTLAKYVSPQKVKELILSDGLQGLGNPKPEKGVLDFIVVAVDGQNLEEISERIAAVADLALVNDGLVLDMIDRLVVITYGMFPEPGKGNRFGLVAALQRAFPTKLKIIHGCGFGHYGNFGSKCRISFTFQLPGFLDALGELSRINFGETKEIQLKTEL